MNFASIQVFFLTNNHLSWIRREDYVSESFNFSSRYIERCIALQAEVPSPDFTETARDSFFASSCRNEQLPEVRQVCLN